MRYRVLTVGRRAEDPLVAAAELYLDRLGRYVTAELVRLREGTVASERDAFARALRPGEHVVALDERGVAQTTEQLTKVVSRWARGGVRTATFLVGGADGLHPELAPLARETWALSRFTLPHRLALVVLLEQLYRAHTILRGEPYHRV